jgi:hypothetical protein
MPQSNDQCRLIVATVDLSVVRAAVIVRERFRGSLGSSVAQGGDPRTPDYPGCQPVGDTDPGGVIGLMTGRAGVNVESP